MSTASRIVVVGSYNTDLMARTPRMPQPGETILGGPFHVGPGGKGANQAVAAARLGVAVQLVASLGEDSFGDQAQQNLVREGIDTSHVLRTGRTHTGAALIFVDAQGENMIVVAPGANDLLSPEHVEGARDAIRAADVLLVQLEVPMPTVERACLLAREAGVRVLLNPAPGRALDAGLLQTVDVLIPNETEAEIISGIPVSDRASAEAAGRELLQRGVGAVVMTLGAEGALVVTDDGVTHVPARPVKAVDTTGAGDAFCGALAVGLAEGQSLHTAVAFAGAAAAVKVTRLGTAPAMPRRPEVEALLAGGPR